MTPALLGLQLAPAVETASTAAVTRFVGYVLLVVAAAIFGHYARRNDVHERMGSRSTFWRYLFATGVTGSLYGVFGLLDLATGARWALAFKYGTLLLFAVALSFAMREVYLNSAAAPSEDDLPLSISSLRRIETAFVAVVMLEWVGVLALGQTGVIRFVEGAGGVAFAAYGIAFGEQVQSRTMTRGTPLDTLIRHLIPVLGCVGCIALVDLAAGFDVAPALTGSLKSVFVVMVATFLVTATIRLQQNVEGL